MIRYQCKETPRYPNPGESVEEGVIVRKSITNLIDFASCRQNKKSLKYAFLDMTGDGIEELIIACGEGGLYVIQYDYGALKVIFNMEDYGNANPVKWNGRTGICVFCSDNRCLYEAYYFFDENEKREISLCSGWNSEGEMSYRSCDNDSFEWYSISEGAYYDMTEIMTEMDIDWQKLEDPTYGND